MPLPRQRRRPLPTSKAPPGTLFIVLCPACNAVLPSPVARFSHTDTSRRTIQLTCGACRTPLSLHVPARRARIAEPYQCPPRHCQPGTQPAILLPPAKGDRLLRHQTTTRAKTDRPYLRQRLLLKPENYQGPLAHLKGFPLRPVVEQLAFCTRLGLRLDQAVLATLLSEYPYIFAMPPRTRVLEMLLAGLVSIMLPVGARPLPPAWAFTDADSRAGSRRAGLITFRSWRLWYAWGRVRPFHHAPPPALADQYRLLATVLAPLRPMVLALCRPIKADGYRFPPDTLPGNRSDALMRVVWETCCPGYLLDYPDQYAACRDIPHLQAWF